MYHFFSAFATHLVAKHLKLEGKAKGVSRATIYAARGGRPLYGGTNVKLIAALKRIESPAN
jgi:hypothetical protein